LNKTYEVDARDAIVIKAMATADRPEGASMLLYAVRTLSLGATAEQFALDTMSKGGTFKGILKQESVVSGVPGIDTITDKEAKKAANSIQDQWDAGADIATDPSAGNLQQVSQSFQDLQIPTIMDKGVEAVARVFGIPLPLMYTSTNAVYKSVDDAWHTFYTLTIQPMLEDVELEFNGKLLNQEDKIIRFKFDSRCLCLDSDKSKAETNNIYVAGGIMTPNEARARLGLPPIEGGDRLRGQQTTDNGQQTGQQTAVSNE
jgi:HK97 family phage portal protein